MSENTFELSMYRRLVGCRTAEQAIVDLNERRVLSDHHSALGQEGVATGVGMAVQDSDSVLGTHRSRMMLAIARGGYSLTEAILHNFGLAPGPADRIEGRPRTLRGVGLIGSALPMSLGVAMADRLRGSDAVSVSFFGDGAANEGAGHETMNHAGARRLPIVFILENNGLSISMPTSEATAARELVSRAEGYGITGSVVDGNDTLAVYQQASDAVQRAREGEGPTLIEARLYRWDAHADGVAEVRSQEDIATARQHDCVAGLRSALLEAGSLTAQEVEAIEADCRREVEAAVEQALNTQGEGGTLNLTPRDAWHLTYADQSIR